MRLRDVELGDVEAYARIAMIVPDESAPETVAGGVTLWSHEDDGEPISEIGWMVLPEFQGRGLDVRFADRVIHANHWSINPRSDLPGTR